MAQAFACNIDYGEFSAIKAELLKLSSPKVRDNVLMRAIADPMKKAYVSQMKPRIMANLNAGIAARTRKRKALSTKAVTLSKDSTAYRTASVRSGSPILHQMTGRLYRNMKIAKVQSKQQRTGYRVLVYLPERAKLGITKDYKWYYPTALEYGSTKNTRRYPARRWLRSAVDAGMQSWASQACGQIAPAVARLVTRRMQQAANRARRKRARA